MVELAPADTWPLRRTVLRNDTPSTDVVLDGDDDSTTLHLGVVDQDGRVIAISTWIRRPFPEHPADAPAVQLRAMAIEPGLQRTGVGRLLVERGLERAASDGVAVVWANARDTALGFYTALGFEVLGDGFVDAATSLPHHRIARHL